MKVLEFKNKEITEPEQNNDFCSNVLKTAEHRFGDPQTLLDGIRILQTVAEEAMRCKNAKIIRAMIELGVLEMDK